MNVSFRQISFQRVWIVAEDESPVPQAVTDFVNRLGTRQGQGVRVALDTADGFNFEVVGNVQAVTFGGIRYVLRYGGK